MKWLPKWLKPRSRGEVDEDLAEARSQLKIDSETRTRKSLDASNVIKIVLLMRDENLTEEEARAHLAELDQLVEAGNGGH